MRDYVYQDPDGRLQFVADMSTAEIQTALSHGVVILPGKECTSPSPEAVLERLRVELVVRSLGDAR